MQFSSVMYNPCNNFRHNRSNVELLFQWFENQDRHTVHTHLLVWLKEVANYWRGSYQSKYSKRQYFLSLPSEFIIHFLTMLHKCYSDMSVTFYVPTSLALIYWEKKTFCVTIQYTKISFDQLLLKWRNC